MTVLKPRTRTISVRLSEEEYSALRRLCALSGARSVSELARNAMLVLLGSLNREETGGISIVEFRAQMKSLDRKIERLVAEVTSKTDDSNR